MRVPIFGLTGAGETPHLSPLPLTKGRGGPRRLHYQLKRCRVQPMNETLAARALNILHDWVKSESLRKHCYAVADSMKHFAQLRGEDVDLWEAVGLLHDMDYERHPGLAGSDAQAIHSSAWHGCATTAGAKKFAARFFLTPITQTSRERRRWRKRSTLWTN